MESDGDEEEWDDFSEGHSEGESIHNDDEEISNDEDFSDEDGEEEETFDRLLEDIRRGRDIYIHRKEVFDDLLARIDEFVEALAGRTRIEDFFVDWTGTDGGALSITKKNREAWDKFFRALGASEDLSYLDLIVENVSVKVATKFLEALPDVESVLFHFDLDTPGHPGNDVREFMQVVSGHSCNRIDFIFDGFKLTRPWHRPPSDRLGAQTTNSQLLTTRGLRTITIHMANLTADEGRSLGNLLSSNACCPEEFELSSTEFLDGGGKFVAAGFERNTSVTKLVLLGSTMQDESFASELAHSIPLCSSMETLDIKADRDCNVKLILDLVTEVVRKSASMRTVTVLSFGEHSETDLETMRETLHSEIRDNYSITSLYWQKRDPFIDVVTRLNRSGRSYIREDATSASRCIEVLDNVKDDLDCLFFHLRENPIALFGGSRTLEDETVGTSGKRKASGAADDESKSMDTSEKPSPKKPSPMNA